MNHGKFPLRGCDLSQSYLLPLSFGTPLQSTCLGGHEDIIRLLLEPRYKLSTSDFEFYIASLQAALGGHLNIVMLLLKKAAHRTMHREFILSEASMCQDLVLVPSLLQPHVFRLYTVCTI